MRKRWEVVLRLAGTGDPYGVERFWTRTAAERYVESMVPVKHWLETELRRADGD